MHKSAKEILIRGLCENSSVVTQFLGLCPLLAVTTSAANALGLGLTVTFVLTMTNFSISLLRYCIPSEIRISIYMVIISSLVSIAQMLINAFAFRFYQTIGIFIPLVATNCVIVGRAETFAIKNNLILSSLDGFFTGIRFTCMMFLLGSLREILGNGTLFRDIDTLFGDWAKIFSIQVFCINTPFLLAILPPGAFIFLGIMLAIKNLVEKKFTIVLKTIKRII